MQVVASTWDLADRLFDGKLAVRLATEVAAGDSFDTIASRLTADGIAVSRETVRRWCIELGIDTSRGRGNAA